MSSQLDWAKKEKQWQQKSHRGYVTSTRTQKFLESGDDVDLVFQLGEFLGRAVVVHNFLLLAVKTNGSGGGRQVGYVGVVLVLELKVIDLLEGFN